jgi:serine/threonine-protein kinase
MEHKKGSVLCVDDEPNILRALRWLLQREFDVTVAASGHEALALVRQHDFDVVISDQRMPGMTGVEFLREVCQIAPRAMRILLTGYSDLQAVMRSVNESEVFRFISKPWHIEELPKVVAEAARIARASPAPKPALPEAMPRRDEAPETVLLIDDDPAIPEVLRLAVGPKIRIIHAHDLPSAVDLLSNEDVGVIVSDTQVNHADATRLLKMIKQQFPEVVTVVLTSAADAGNIVALINQGQIYRFIPKPIKAGFLRLALTSALLKRQQLKETPSFAARHLVQGLDASEKETFMHEVRHLAMSTPGGTVASRPNAENDETLFHRIGTGFRRLFGI